MCAISPDLSPVPTPLKARGVPEAAEDAACDSATASAADDRSFTESAPSASSEHALVLRVHFSIPEDGSELPQPAVPPPAVPPAVVRAREELQRQGVSLTTESFYDALTGRGPSDRLRTVVAASYLTDDVYGAAMCAAAELGQEQAIAHLAAAGVSVDTPRDNGTTALIAAAQHRRDALCTKLVTHFGADVNCVNQEGVTAMAAACAAGRGELCRLLLRLGGDPHATFFSGDTLFAAAASAGDVALCGDLIARGVDVNEANETTGASALILAAGRGDLALCQFLIKHGADVNRSTHNGTTPLMAAARHGHAAVCVVLCSRGADMNAQRADGWTALTIAKTHGHDRLCGQLARRGADPDAIADAEGHRARDGRRPGRVEQAEHTGCSCLVM
eukprot:TRINITY_DN2547_c1_g4_i1.p1 TRINITY_DN2547_c1_g4~~TRINITY_DN2547_c1_g4_i1.p1  ORF type:complete len:390 (+),score=90.80 TRINITY_DN2547_c1_g4_i1:67-1236(+)